MGSGTEKTVKSGRTTGSASQPKKTMTRTTSKAGEKKPGPSGKVAVGKVPQGKVSKQASETRPKAKSKLTVTKAGGDGKIKGNTRKDRGGSTRPQGSKIKVSAGKPRTTKVKTVVKRKTVTPTGSKGKKLVVGSKVSPRTFKKPLSKGPVTKKQEKKPTKVGEFKAEAMKHRKTYIQALCQTLNSSAEKKLSRENLYESFLTDHGKTASGIVRYHFLKALFQAKTLGYISNPPGHSLTYRLLKAGEFVALL